MRRLSLPAATRERRWDHRDFERWCLRIETADETKSTPETGGGGGDEENDMVFGHRETKRIDSPKLIEKPLTLLRNFIKQMVCTSCEKKGSQ